jgi:hypothetical protein
MLGLEPRLRGGADDRRFAVLDPLVRRARVFHSGRRVKNSHRPMSERTFNGVVDELSPNRVCHG